MLAATAIINAMILIPAALLFIYHLVKIHEYI